MALLGVIAMGPEIEISTAHRFNILKIGKVIAIVSSNGPGLVYGIEMGALKLAIANGVPERRLRCCQTSLGGSLDRHGSGNVARTSRET